MQNVKLCRNCNEVKDLIGGFYKAGDKAHQKYCKVCHNKKRGEFKNVSSYKHVEHKGFDKIPIDIQNKIIYDHHIKISLKEIVEKYKTDYPKLKYQSLCKYKRTGKIPTYINKDIENII